MATYITSITESISTQKLVEEPEYDESQTTPNKEENLNPSVKSKPRKIPPKRDLEKL